jgi:hypothetical protein
MAFSDGATRVLTKTSLLDYRMTGTHAVIEGN